MRIINSHCHIFPEKIAAKASASIGGFYNHPLLFEEASAEVLKQHMIETGVEKSVVCSVATKVHQVESINNFLALENGKNKDTFIALGAMHPDYEDVEKEVERIISLGLYGIKLHPDFQEFEVDSKKAYKIYEAAEGRLPILFHTGDPRYDFSNPKRMSHVLKDFPKLTAICAHFGGWEVWDDAIKYLGDMDIYVDTCSSIKFMSEEKARELGSVWGSKRILFGTDFPMWRNDEEIKRLDVLGFSEKEMEDVLYNNAAKIFLKGK